MKIYFFRFFYSLALILIITAWGLILADLINWKIDAVKIWTYPQSYYRQYIIFCIVTSLFAGPILKAETELLNKREK